MWNHLAIVVVAILGADVHPQGRPEREDRYTGARRMPPVDERWQRLSAADWDDFAKDWLAELRGGPSAPEWDVGQSVVLMGVSATPEQQWRFIRAAVAHARSDDELGHIAAGPVEHLLGWHGEKMIALVEQRAAADRKFARMLTGASKYLMSDAVWSRVRAIQASVPDRLPSMRE